jgi:ubiquinone/menaquinone biosynthesis C-methylase UbiE
MRTLSAQEAKSFYDDFGSKQDSQAFYEERALSELVAHAAMRKAQSVFEFGCGTGRFALQLLERHLPATAHYRGTDISSTMVEIATRRLAPFAARASVALANEELTLPVGPTSIDRFVSTYVLDLLSASDQQQLLAEARRSLKPGGLLCLCGITPGVTARSRMVMGVWRWLFARSPRLVGGCRPIRASDYLSNDAWQLLYRSVVVAWGVASEVVIATPLEPTARA